MLVADQLRLIRNQEGIQLKPSPFISGKIRDYTGEIIDCVPRNYQAQGVLHLAKMSEFVLGDEPGLGKTLQGLYAYAYLRHYYPHLKLLWVGPKNSLPDKEDEVQVMLNLTRPLYVAGSKKKRHDAWHRIRPSGVEVALCNYHTLMNDYTEIERCYAGRQFMVVFDEAHVLANTKTKTHRAAKHISRQALRRVGLTATMIRNRLMEAYGVFRVVVPDLFPTKTWFETTYCVFDTLRFGPRRIEKLTGYRNLDHFRKLISPYFLARTPEMVGDELPEIVWDKVNLTMNPKQAGHYAECMAGLLKKRVTDPLTGDEYDENIQGALRILMNSMLIANAPQMVPQFEHLTELSSKEEWILDSLQNEMSEEKVVIFSWFKKWSYRLKKLIEDKLGFVPMTITGDDSDKVRSEVKKRFNQNPTSDANSNVVIITAAGKEAINLTAARHMILANLPWSYGDLRQIVGRIARQGSKWQKVIAHMLINKTTVDEKVYDVLKSKQGLSQMLMNDSLTSLDAVSGSAEVERIVAEMRAEVRV